MQDIGQWLRALGLDKYVEAFLANDIDMEVLPELAESDFAELGLSLGHRKRLLRALATLESGAPAEPPATAATPAPAAGAPSVADRRQLTVLFSDLIGSTELSRRLDPEDMRDVLRGYQNAVSGEIARFEGHVAKFMGDGIFAYFGWPKAHEDQAERAVHAGLGILDAVKRVGAPTDVGLNVRVGIATGQVVVGDLLGEGSAEEAAVTGETPNLAARLQEIAGAGQIVIAGATRRLIGNVFELEEKGPAEIKGFAEPVAVWRVVGASRIESRFEATHAQGGAVPLVGRTHELGLLTDRWQQAKAGQGQVVLLSGEAGIGKSRLVQALRTHVADEMHFRLRYQCSPYHTNSALYPIIGRMERAAGFGPDDTVDTKLDKLERLLRLSGSEIDEHMPFFASMLSLPLRGRYRDVELPPEQHKEQTLAALIEQLVALAQRRPVLSIYEDAQWLDPTTREMLGRIVARIADAPVLLVITHRPEWSHEWVGAHDHVYPLTLSRLAGDQPAALVRTIADRPLDPALVDRIASRTDGIPLFIEELTRSLFDAGADGPAEVGEIPDTLQDLLQARLDGLTPEVREAAQVGAVIGREFRVDILQRAIGGGADYRRTLERLVTSRLVLPSGSAAQPSYVFRHALMQETAYNSLLLRRRRDYHHAIAVALEELSPETADLAPELIAEHFTRAGKPERAITHWRRAGQRALEHSANLEAVEHLQQGIAAIDGLPEGPEQLRLRLDFHLALGNALLKASQPVEAIRIANGAARLARLAKAPVDLARAAITFEEAEFLYSQPEDASIFLLEEALQAIGEEESPERCRLLGGLSRAYSTVGQLQRALEVGQRASEMARRIGDRRALFDIQFNNYLATAHADLAGAQESLTEAAALAEELGDIDLISRTNSIRLYNLLQLGEIEAFDALRASSRSLTEQFHMPLHAWVLTSAEALRAILTGDFAEAETLAERALAAGQMVQPETASGVYGMQMFTIRREQGRLGEVAPIFKRFVDEHPEEASWRPGLALIASDLGFLEPARKSFDDMAREGFPLPYDAKRNTTLSYLAEVCARIGDAERARQLYELLLPYRDLTVTVGTCVVCLGSAARYLGMLSATASDWDAAIAHFETALAQNAKMGAVPWVAHTQADLAAALRSRGGRDNLRRADDLLDAAWSTARKHDMVRLKDRLGALRQ